MLFIQTEADRQRQEEATREHLLRMAKESGEKAKRREEWKKVNTCPHCGHCPPFPGDLW